MRCGKDDQAVLINELASAAGGAERELCKHKLLGLLLRLGYSPQ